VKAGIPAPESTSKNDDAFQVWVDKYADRVPFVAAVAKYRSVNRALSVLEAMRVRHVDDRLRYSLKYYGAVPTGRWAGDSGLNMQNFTRDAVEGVNIRQMLVAAPGKKFVSADLSQIEPRVSLYVTGDSTQLDLIRKGMCIYEAHARQTLGYDLPITMKEAAKSDESISKMRQFAKARVLGLTYGQWGKGFQAYAKTFGIELTLDQAQEQVAQFRRANPKLVKFWENLELGLRMSRGQTFDLELPSGRFMRYFDVAVSRNAKGFADYRARPVRGEHATYYSQGKLHNNVCQGTARDELGEAVLAIEYELGLPVVLTVHDEVLVEVDAADAEDARVEVSRTMARPPEWMPDLPLASDCFVSDRYEK